MTDKRRIGVYVCHCGGNISDHVNVKEVAAALGYDDQFYFSRVFKAVNNVPPSRYRTSRSNYGERMENSSPPPALSKEILIPV